jgi:hypothetical protein
MLFPEKMVKYIIWHFSYNLKIYIDKNYEN